MRARPAVAGIAYDAAANEARAMSARLAALTIERDELAQRGADALAQWKALLEQYEQLSV